MNEKLLSISEVARQLGVHVNTVRSWSDKGYIEHVRLPSGYRRFTQEAVDRLKRSMEQNESSGRQQEANDR